MTRTGVALAWLVWLSAATQAPGPVAPPNAPADISVFGGSIAIQYDGGVVFEGRIDEAEALRDVTLNTYREGDALSQVLALTARSGRDPVAIVGTITASDQAFAAESDRPLGGLPIVRHSSGASDNLRNQAVYDRRRDWVLSVDDQPRTFTRVHPIDDDGDRRRFAIEARGSEIVLRFRPRFYQQHRHLAFFEPWTYEVWPHPVVGWVSWFAFFDRVTEADIRRTADVLADRLGPYGYEYLQIDDGYQSGKGLPPTWLTANEKFPSGLPALAEYVRSKGLKPGLWTAATFSEADEAAAHADWFVRDADGRPVRGNWIDYAVDGSNPAALDALVRPIYRELRRTGWEYFKVDALRHLRYEGYNAHADHFARQHANLVDAYRRYVRSIREEVGRDRFILACWGVRPELVGLVDGCRLGTDGFSFAGLAQFNSFNNVVWRNDPDHIELSDQEAWRSTTVTSLTGSLFLLTDRPERYLTPFVEPARRAAPVLVTTPGQLYDVDPSRSGELWRVDSEVSGRDPKPFDAGMAPAAQLYQLDIARPFERWTVLGRTGGVFDEIPFGQLGLDAAREHLVFEFWSRRLRGSFSGGFPPGPIDARYGVQVFVIRPRLDHPQVVATNRHLTGGGVDLVDVTWTDDTLAGTSRVVGGENYEIYLFVPPGFTFESAACDEAEALPPGRTGGVVTIGCRASSSRIIAWRAHFERGAGPP
jgi:alpha-galactosidase